MYTTTKITIYASSVNDYCKRTKPFVKEQDSIVDVMSTYVFSKKTWKWLANSILNKDSNLNICQEALIKWFF